MSDERPSDVLGALPRRRPHRRSAKRAPARRAPASRPERLRQPAQPAGAPRTPPQGDRTDRTTGRDVLGIAAQAAAELAEIGLHAGARALRNAVGRLPRP